MFLIQETYFQIKHLGAPFLKLEIYPQLPESYIYLPYAKWRHDGAILPEFPPQKIQDLR